MRGNLYINSELVEAEITIPLNFISNQLNDLNDKRAGMSGTIILEKNEKYNEDSEIWNSKIDCDYFFSGIKLVSNGEARVLKFTKTEVHLKIYFGALLLTELLKDLKINELIDATLDVEWSFDNIKNLDCETDDVCFLFANACVFTEDVFLDSGNVKANKLIPAVRVRKILELIEDETGIEFTGDFATDTLLEKMWMPLNTNKGNPLKNFEAYRTEEEIKDRNKTNEIELITTGQNVTNDVWNILVNTGNSGECVLSESDTVLKVLIATNYNLNLNFNFNYVIDTYQYQDGGYNVRKTYDVTMSAFLFVTKNWDGNIATIINSSIKYQKIIDLEVRTANKLYKENVNVNVKNYELQTTDEIQFILYLQKTNDKGIGVDPYKSSLRGITFWEFNGIEAEITRIGQEFPIMNNLPELSAMEFLKSLIQKKGFILEYDALSEKYKLNYFKRLYENFMIADDWSDKYVTSEITDIYGVFAKNNKFYYTNDKDVSEDYGSHTEAVDKQTLPYETIILKDITAGTTQEKFEEFSNDFEICRIPAISEKKLEWEITKPRFVLVERLAVETITIKDGVNTDTMDEINRAWFQDGDNFNLNYKFIVENYYTDFITMFPRYRKYIIQAHLHSADCLRSQLIPVYIKQLNAYFFIEKINFVNENQLATIEAIRL